ncbi:MazG-like family protein [Streptococcus suis]
MTKTLDEKVQQWFIDRNLHEANPVKQFEKLMEEAGELFEGVAKGKSDLIKDALGDMQVVLTGLELQVKNGADIRATPEEMELLLMVASLGNLSDRLHKHIYHNETMTPLIRIKVEISDTVFVLQQKQGTLDIYSGDEE